MRHGSLPFETFVGLLLAISIAAHAQVRVRAAPEQWETKVLALQVSKESFLNPPQRELLELDPCYIPYCTNEYHYRSTGNGFWSDTGTWQTSVDSTNWVAASVPPDADNSLSILIQDSHFLTLDQNITIDEMTIDTGGDVMIGAGNTMLVDNGHGVDLSIGGSLTVTGTLTVTQSAEVMARENSTIYYKSNTAQSISPGFPSHVYNLVFNNPNGISIGTEISIDGTFSLTSGTYSCDSELSINGLQSPSVMHLNISTTAFTVEGFATHTYSEGDCYPFIDRQWEVSGFVNDTHESHRKKTLTFFWTSNDDN